MIYFYKSKFGAFSIQPDQQQPGLWRLYIGDMWLGSYNTPQQAADDVYLRQTGCDAWDDQLIVTHPINLEEWQSVQRRH